MKRTPSGRTVLRSNYGRFYGTILTGELGGIHPGQTPTTTARFDTTTGQYSRIISVVDNSNQRIDLDMPAPHTDQVSVSVDREVSKRMGVTAAYVHKAGNDFIASEDTGGRYLFSQNFARPNLITATARVVPPLVPCSSG